MEVVTSSILCNTQGDGDTIDLTDSLSDELRRTKLKDGVVTVFVRGSTAAITTIEYEPGAVSDLKDVFESIAPADRDWRHHLRWGDHNGHSHVRSALLGASFAIPFVDGRLTLGTWQQVVLIDFDDKPRRRKIIAQFIGS